MRNWLRRVPRGVYVALALLQATVLTVLSHVPGEKLPSQGWFFSWAFNFAHAPMFFVLAAFTAGALARRESGVAVALPAGKAASCVALAFFYGLFDEWHQSFVSHRSSDAVDLVTDLAGITAAVIVARALVAERPAAFGKAVVGVGLCALIGVLSAAFAARAV